MKSSERINLDNSSVFLKSLIEEKMYSSQIEECEFYNFKFIFIYIYYLYYILLLYWFYFIIGSKTSNDDDKISLGGKKTL